LWLSGVKPLLDVEGIFSLQPLSIIAGKRKRETGANRADVGYRETTVPDALERISGLLAT